jgi:hypothetical protein
MMKCDKGVPGVRCTQIALRLVAVLRRARRPRNNKITTPSTASARRALAARCEPWSPRREPMSHLRIALPEGERALG